MNEDCPDDCPDAELCVVCYEWACSEHGDNKTFCGIQGHMHRDCHDETCRSTRCERLAA